MPWTKYQVMYLSVTMCCSTEDNCFLLLLFKAIIETLKKTTKMLGAFCHCIFNTSKIIQ